MYDRDDKKNPQFLLKKSKTLSDSGALSQQDCDVYYERCEAVNQGIRLLTQRVIIFSFRRLSQVFLFKKQNYKNWLQS